MNIELRKHKMIPIFFEQEFIARVIDDGLFKLLRPLLLDYISSCDMELLGDYWADLIRMHEIFAEQMRQ